MKAIYVCPSAYPCPPSHVSVWLTACFYSIVLKIGSYKSAGRAQKWRGSISKWPPLEHKQPFFVSAIDFQDFIRFFSEFAHDCVPIQTRVGKGGTDEIQNDPNDFSLSAGQNWLADFDSNVLKIDTHAHPSNSPD